MPGWFKACPTARNGSTRLSSTGIAASLAELRVASRYGRSAKTSSQLSSRISPTRASDSHRTLSSTARLSRWIRAGRVSFNLLQHHRSKAHVLVFYAFDVLIYRGRSVLNVPLYFRREVLHRIFGDSNAAPIGLSENIEAAPTDLIRVAKEFGFEGIVAKRKDSFYESGKRTGAWVKYKVNRGQEFVIGGYTPGSPFDALIVGYYKDGKLLYAANVRNGFVP